MRGMGDAGANVLGPNLHLCYSNGFLHLCPPQYYSIKTQKTKPKTKLTEIPQSSSVLQYQNSPPPAPSPLRPARLTSVNPRQPLRWNNLTVDPQSRFIKPLVSSFKTLLLQPHHKVHN